VSLLVVQITYFGIGLEDIESRKSLEGGNANTRRGVLVLVDFQDDYHSVNYQIIYLVSIYCHGLSSTAFSLNFPTSISALLFIF